MSDEYEALWRKAAYAYGGLSIEGETEGYAAAVLREHIESALAEVRAENERLAKAWEAQHAEKVREKAEAKLWFDKAQEWKAALADRDRTIAEQAAEIERGKGALKHALQFAIGVIAFVGRDDGSDRLPDTLARICSEASDLDRIVRTTLGGQHA